MLGMKFFSKKTEKSSNEKTVVKIHQARLVEIKESIATVYAEIESLVEAEKSTIESKAAAARLLATGQYKFVVTQKNVNVFEDQRNEIIKQRQALIEKLDKLKEEKALIEQAMKQESKQAEQQVTCGKFFENLQEYKKVSNVGNPLNIQEKDGEEQYTNLLRL